MDNVRDNELKGEEEAYSKGVQLYWDIYAWRLAGSMSYKAIARRLGISEAEAINGAARGEQWYFSRFRESVHEMIRTSRTE